MSNILHIRRIYATPRLLVLLRRIRTWPFSRIGRSMEGAVALGPPATACRRFEGQTRGAGFCCSLWHPVLKPQCLPSTPAALCPTPAMIDSLPTIPACGPGSARRCRIRRSKAQSGTISQSVTLTARERRGNPVPVRTALPRLHLLQQRILCCARIHVIADDDTHGSTLLAGTKGRQTPGRCRGNANHRITADATSYDRSRQPDNA